MAAEGKRRFEMLLEGRSSQAAAEYDRPLLARTDWIVAPTLGAIVPNWLLLIPRDPALNFRIWSETTLQSPLSLVNEVRQHLGLDGKEIIWFEHGPRGSGTVTGCGLDHAHIHLLIRPGFSFDAFISKARALSNLDWVEGKTQEAYQRLSLDESYFIAGFDDMTVSAHNVESAGSQFFRRVISMLADAYDTWDYRQHPNIDRVTETIRTFRSLESTTQRGD